MQTTKAIVLRTVRYSDSRIVVSLFTELYGMISAVVRVAHGVKKGGRTALWQLMNIVEVNVDYRESSDLQKVGEVFISAPWKDLPYNPYKASICMFLSEFLYHCLREEGENRKLFSFLENSLIWFDEADQGISFFHLILMLRITRFLGIWPRMDDYKPGCFFDLRGACFVQQAPTHGQYIEPVESALLSSILNLDYSAMSMVRMSRNERRHMLDMLLRYYQIHVPGLGELQSLDVLRELFS